MPKYYHQSKNPSKCLAKLGSQKSYYRSFADELPQRVQSEPRRAAGSIVPHARQSMEKPIEDQCVSRDLLVNAHRILPQFVCSVPDNSKMFGPSCHRASNWDQRIFLGCDRVSGLGLKLRLRLRILRIYC